MKKLTYPERICLLMMVLFLSPYFIQPLLAQSDDCEKIRVGIYFTYLADGVIDHLNKKYGTRSKGCMDR